MTLNLDVIVAEPTWPVMLPFGILLLAIGLGPLIAQYHWERHYHQLCVVLAGAVCVHQIFLVHQTARVLHAAIDYATFMIVVGSFFVVSGSIHLRVRGPSNSAWNTLFLFVGAVLANLVGTIAASVLLIRPWITMNRGRIAPMHVAFFIFLVSNIGGALLPVGPPLFLGFLKGVPFWWTAQHCWRPWLIAVGILLLIFFVLDSINLRSSKKTGQESDLISWKCDGAHNFIVLIAILAALIAVPAGWRELMVVLIALGSYLGTSKRTREANNFTFAPLKEVGWLFLGIFGTMIPVLEFMEQSAAKLGLNSTATFYWATGMLSALFDNAPTYLAFFAAALGLRGYRVDEPQQNCELHLRKWPAARRDFVGRGLFRRAHLHRQRAQPARKNNRRTLARADAELYRIHFEVRAANSAPGSRWCRFCFSPRKRFTALMFF